MARPFANPRVAALFGDPVAESLSPVMHQAAFLAAGLSWTYLPFRVGAAELPARFAALKAEGLAGANFTYPCKEAATALCDDLSREAAALGAVNTARLPGDGKVEGFNTDVYGFARAILELGWDLAGQSALVLGAGAAARAVGLALEVSGAAVTFAARDLSRPRPGVSSQAAVIRLEDSPVFIGARRPALVVNATPAGLRADDPPLFDYGVLKSARFVMDLNYGRETLWLTAARAAGVTTADGLLMLLHQACRAFELWTGAPAPVDAMRRAADGELRKRRL